MPIYSVSMRGLGLPDLFLLADLQQIIADTITLHQSEEKMDGGNVEKSISCNSGT